MKAALADRPVALKLLARAEKAVVDNPFHLTKRMVHPDGTMRDWNTVGVILGFDVEDDETVRFHTFHLTMKLVE